VFTLTWAASAASFGAPWPRIRFDEPDPAL